MSSFTLRRDPLKRAARFAFCAAALLVANQALATTSINVLVVYTQKASDWATKVNYGCNSLPDGAAASMTQAYELTQLQHICLSNPSFATGSDKMKNLIDIAMWETNQVYYDSGVDVQFKLVGPVKLNGFDETFDATNIHHEEPFAQNLAKSLGISRLLYGMRNRISNPSDFAGDPQGLANDQILKSVHSLRATYGADLVLLLADDVKDKKDPNDTDAEPVAPPLYQIDPKDPEGRNTLQLPGLAMGIGVGTPRDGFAALRADWATTPRYTFAHELSHLMGANHFSFNNGVNIAFFPAFGPMDNLSNLPLLNPDTGKPDPIDNWGYKHTVANGQPAFDMYSDIMSPVVDASGFAVVPDFKDNKTVVSNLAWKGSLSTDGKNTCSIVDKSTAPLVRPIKITTLPVLSTLNAKFPVKAFVAGSAGSAGSPSIACLNIQLTFSDGTTSPVEAKLLNDGENIPRNAARMVEAQAPTIASFHSQLAGIVDPVGPVVGIDFGPTAAQGWNILGNMFSAPFLLSTLVTENYPFATCELASGCAAHVTGGTQKLSGQYWNNMNATAANSVLSNLVDQRGANTGGILTITKKFYGTGKLPGTLEATLAQGRDEAATMALSDYFTAVSGYTPPELTISGLDNSRLYTFRVFGTDAVANAYRVADFTLTSNNGSGGSVSAMKVLGTQGNISRYVEYAHVRPLNGTVTLKVATDATVPVPFLGDVGLSAMTYWKE